MIARRFVQLLCAAILFATSPAAAEPGQIVLVGGQVVAGEIQEVAKGEYVIIKLANGDLRAFAWADIASLTFGAGGSVGASTAPPPVYQPAPTPPMVVYVAPPPPFVPPPRLPPPPRPRFEPAVTLGVRVGTMAAAGNVYGDDYYYDHHDYYRDAPGPELRMNDVAGWGWMVEGDLGYHFSPSWTIYGFWEHGKLDHGDLNRNWGHTNAVGLGINANTSPYDPFGFYFDVGAAYRWMEFTDASLDPNRVVTTRTTAEGFEYLKTAVGVAISMGHKFRLDPHVYTSTGYFTRFRGSGCADCFAGTRDIDYGVHWLSGIAVTGRYDL